MIEDVWATLGPLFDGGVVDASEVMISQDWRPDRGQKVKLGQVFWGPDLRAIDAAAIAQTQPLLAAESKRCVDGKI